MSDDLVSRLRSHAEWGEAGPKANDGKLLKEAATALTEARAEIERLRIIFGEFKQNTERHDERLSGQIKTLVGQKTYWMDRLTLAESELSTLRARVREVVGPFLNIRDQFPESSKLILKKFDGFTPIGITVTKDQFRAARQLNEDLK